MKLPALGIFLLAVIPAGAASLSVSGGITLNGVQQPLLFTWESTVSISGSGWTANEPVEIFLHGPLNSLDVIALTPRTPRVTELARIGVHRIGGEFNDYPLGVFTADANGNLAASPVIPYDSGITGLFAKIPRPGYYEIYAGGPRSGIAAAASQINLCPATYTGGSPGIDWGHERGGRTGILPGPLAQFSPELFDPEWPTTWDHRTVEVYGTIAPTGTDGNNQPSQISFTDNPATHYAHDVNFFMTPDPAYRWLIGTANYYSGNPGSVALGTMELEWETLNGGSTSAYAQGNIGVPLWANPTPGDRMYLVGRWILDAGHPEVGDRSEMHPPRLVATIRKRPAASRSGAAATEVDLFVSGHGGGANMMPPGLTEILDQDGRGGGRIKDALSPSDQKTYYQPGPLSSLLVPLVEGLIEAVTGQSINLNVSSNAGPSAFPWGGPGPEFQPVGDMDYDFDVPLPSPPQGATSVILDVTNMPQHTTAVSEVVTYSGNVAHVHLPYKFADNGTYARILKFSWNNAPPPANHFVVRLNKINVKDSGGKWQMWADVSGQWSYLSGAAPALLNTSAGQSVTLPGNPVDVYAGAGDTVRIYVQGYHAACLDDYFGKLFGQSAYVAGLTFVASCGPTDNQDLGGAVLELPVQPAPASTYTITAKDSSGNSHFTVDVSIEPQ